MLTFTQRLVQCEVFGYDHSSSLPEASARDRDILAKENLDKETLGDLFDYTKKP